MCVVASQRSAVQVIEGESAVIEDSDDYDVVVIGGGPGGYIAAIRAAQFGCRTALVEREELGGICLNWGCIPSKALLKSAEVLTIIERASIFGITVGMVHADYAVALARCREIVAIQVRGVRSLMRKHGVTVVHGTGRFLTHGRIAVSDGTASVRELTTRNTIIATGSRVKPLPGLTIDGVHIISAREVWGVETLPRSVLIVGGGAIGVEFATVYRAYGCEVTLVEYLPRLIPLEDDALSDGLTKRLVARGVQVRTATAVQGAAVVNNQVIVRLSPVPVAGDQAPETITVDRVLVAAGFLPNSEEMGLSAVGVAVERGFITVDAMMQTTAPGIYAIGDVTGVLALAHVASAQGEVAAEAIAGHDPAPLDYAAMPRCIYTDPQTAAMGLTEAAARASGRAIRVGTARLRANGKAMAGGDTDGFAKIIADADTGEIIGVHLLGAEVTELIAEAVIARTLESTPRELGRAVHPHPTLSEVIAEAARAVEGVA